MPEDERPVTAQDFREFKEEIRRTLTAIEVSIIALNKGQTDLALQISNNRTAQAEKALADQKEMLQARAEDSNRITGIDFKTKLMWGIGGALLLGAINLLVSRWK